MSTHVTEELHFLSSFLGRPARSQKLGTSMGRIWDAIATLTELYPQVRGLVLRHRQRDVLYPATAEEYFAMLRTGYLFGGRAEDLASGNGTGRRQRARAALGQADRGRGGGQGRARERHPPADRRAAVGGARGRGLYRAAAAAGVGRGREAVCPQRGPGPAGRADLVEVRAAGVLQRHAAGTRAADGGRAALERAASGRTGGHP